MKEIVIKVEDTCKALIINALTSEQPKSHKIGLTQTSIETGELRGDKVFVVGIDGFREIFKEDNE